MPTNRFYIANPHRRSDQIARLNRDWHFIDAMIRLYIGDNLPPELCRMWGRLRADIHLLRLTDAERRAVASVWGN